MGMYLQEKVSLYDTGQHPQYGKIRDVHLDEGDFVFVLTEKVPVSKTGRLYVDTDPSDARVRILNIGPKSRIANSLGMAFVYIRPGEFLMGSPTSEPERNSDERRHKVTLTQGYYLQTGDYPAGLVTDPHGPKSGEDRVSRGGCWYDKAGDCRSAYRYCDTPDRRYYSMGLRLARNP